MADFRLTAIAYLARGLKACTTPPSYHSVTLVQTSKDLGEGSTVETWHIFHLGRRSALAPWALTVQAPAGVRPTQSDFLRGGHLRPQLYRLTLQSHQTGPAPWPYYWCATTFIWLPSSVSWNVIFKCVMYFICAMPWILDWNTIAADYTVYFTYLKIEPLELGMQMSVNNMQICVFCQDVGIFLLMGLWIRFKKEEHLPCIGSLPLLLWRSWPELMLLSLGKNYRL